MEERIQVGDDIEADDTGANGLHPDIDEELFLIERAGEIPEIAYHGAIYYLEEDENGPGLTLTEREKLLLKQAALKCYKRIILRDLTPENRKRRIYRGLERAVINMRRMEKFALKEGFNLDSIKDEIRKALLNFLNIEIEDVLIKGENSCINCNYSELLDLVKRLDMNEDDLPLETRTICLQTK